MVRASPFPNVFWSNVKIVRFCRRLVNGFFGETALFLKKTAGKGKELPKDIPQSNL